MYHDDMKTLCQSRRRFLWALLLGGAWLLLGSSPLAAQTPVILYQAADCRFPIPAGYAVDCGDLTVPQNHSLPSGRTIRLHVAYFHSPNPSAPADPILYLVGGPGVSLLYDIEALFYHFEGYLANRDVIVYDQRGTGYSVPALQCAEPTMRDNAALTCVEFYEAWGVDLEAFNSVESATDAESLRVALGIEQWNVVGVSYGTRLAQVLARDHPAGVRSVILDSVAQLGGVDYGRYGDLSGWVRQILRDCEDDPACAAAYPDVVAQFETLLAEARLPTVVTVDGQRIRIDAGRIAAAAWEHASSTDGAAALPAIITAAAAGDYGPLLDGDTSYTVFDLMNTAMNCNDGVSAMDFCRNLGIQPGPALAEPPIAFTIPTLIVNGNWDTLTPTENAKAVWRALPNATFAEFPYLSHGVVRSGDPCAVGLAFAFLDDPTATLAVECAAQTRPIFVLD